MRFVLPAAALLLIQHSLALNIDYVKNAKCAKEDIGSCGTGWYKIGDNCVKHFDQMMPFKDAQSHCESQNSSLASIRDHDENTKVQCVILMSHGKAVGSYVSAVSHGGSPENSDSSQMEVINWSNGDSQDSSSVSFQSSSYSESSPGCTETVDGGLNLINCSEERSFICSKRF